VFGPSGANTDTYGSANNLNQYVKVTLSGQQSKFLYDGNGNLAFDGANNYSYDPENHLVSAQTTANGTVAYAYDPKGRRTTKSGSSNTTYYLNDGDDEIAEYSGGSVSVRYVPGAEIDHPIAMVPASGSNEYFQTDHHGTVIATTGSTEKPAEGPFVTTVTATARRRVRVAIPTNSSAAVSIRRRTSTTTARGTTRRKSGGSCRRIPSDTRPTWISTPTSEMIQRIRLTLAATVSKTPVS
jgi:YD repeat-containing protein